MAAGTQSARCVLLVRPAAFAYNAETALTNQFQHRPDAAGDAGGAAGAQGATRALQARALAEFDALCAALQAAGVRTCILGDSAEPPKPDAVFPNNWVSWHEDASVVLYPMQAMSRRAERRAELVAAAEQQAGFRRRRLIDLSGHERDGRFLEGTGSLVLDHRLRIAYACRSARTDPVLVAEWARLMQFESLLFDARTPEGTAPYHTNVMLAIGTRWAIVCAQAIVDADRGRVLGRLRASGRSVIEISLQSMQRFAANVLEVRAGDRHIVAMSATAASALRAEPEAWPRLQGCADDIVAAEVPTIEQVGGGSVRCMLAEIFAT